VEAFVELVSITLENYVVRKHVSKSVNTNKISKVAIATFFMN
jgi:hypothetical protein